MSRNDGDIGPKKKKSPYEKAYEQMQEMAYDEAQNKIAEDARQNQYKEYANLWDEISNTYGTGDLTKLGENASVEDIQKAVSDLNAYRDKYGTQSRAESEAAQLANAAATQQAQAQEIAAKNTGLSGSRAGSLASNNTYGNVYRDSVQGLSNQQTMTQADWLEKMGYATGLQQQADNLQKGSTLNTIGAAFQGV